MADPVSPGPGTRPDEDVLAELAEVFGDEPPVVSDTSEPEASEPVVVSDTSEPEASEPVETAAGHGGADPLLPARPATRAAPSLDHPDMAVAAAAGGGRQTIAIGADDELPDAVYLDEELAAEDRSSGTVFIDDDDVEDPIAAKEATAPGIEPRFRQRLIGVRRAQGLRRLRWVALVAAIVLVVGGALAVLGSPLFDIDDVSVEGAVYTDPQALQDVVDDLRGTPVLLADTTEAEERLEAIPWVDQARVTADFPSSAHIELRERTPLVTMRGTNGRFRVLDREGRVLDSIQGQPVAMVLISGPGTLNVPPGEFAAIGYSAAASLVTKFTPAIRVRVQSMMVTPDGSDLRLELSNGEQPPIEVEFGSALGENEQIEKLVRLQRALDDVGTDPVSVINVSTTEVTVV